MALQKTIIFYSECEKLFKCVALSCIVVTTEDSYSKAVLLYRICMGLVDAYASLYALRPNRPDGQKEVRNAEHPRNIL